MLLPALTKARDKARTIFCANNMKQIAIGWSLYLDENDDWCPGAYYHEATRFFPEVVWYKQFVEINILPRMFYVVLQQNFGIIQITILIMELMDIDLASQVGLYSLCK